MCVCGHFSFIHSADIWQSSLTPLFSIRQACSTQQVAAEIVSLLKHWMQLKMLDPLPIWPPLTILWNLSSPLSTSLTHLTGHMQQSDTWINVESLYVMLCTASMLSCSHHWVQNICNLSLVYINKWRKKIHNKKHETLSWSHQADIPRTAYYAYIGHTDMMHVSSIQELLVSFTLMHQKVYLHWRDIYFMIHMYIKYLAAIFFFIILDTLHFAL